MPSRREHDREAVLLHTRVAGLATTRTALEATERIVALPLGDLTSEQWEQLRRNVLAVSHEVQCQIYEALNSLSVRKHEAYGALVRPVFRNASPMTIMQEVLPGYEARASVRGIDIQCRDDSPGTKNIDLEINSVRLMFHNALTNALKYSYKGSSHHYRFIAITCIRRLPMSGGFVITIQNYGVGIKNDELARVWDKGFRGAIAKEERIFGSGLGLSQIRHCMNLHGGRAEIESVQEGDDGPYKTTLTLSFPETNDVRRAV